MNVTQVVDMVIQNNISTCVAIEAPTNGEHYVYKLRATECEKVSGPGRA